MDNKSNYTFSNKYNPSMDYNIFSEQNSRILNNNQNFNFKAQTNNYLGVSYFNNTSNLNNSINNTLNLSNNNSNYFSENNTKLINKTRLIPKIEEEINNAYINNNKINNANNVNNINNINNINNNQKIMNLNFIEEFDKIKNIMNNDPSRNPNLKSQDCLDIYGYPFLNSGVGYSFSQFNNTFKQKYLMKTLFDNKYIYINGKQFHRIMKRREVRKKIKEALKENKEKNKEDKNKKYHHESRHRHAMNRERGKGGRFISKKKVENIENKDSTDKDKDNKDNKENKENKDEIKKEEKKEE